MAPSYQKSEEMFEQAQRIIPGGVNSPVRAFKSVGMNPPFIARANGSRMWDVDGNEYIDYICSWGPQILGHRHPAVIHALQDCLEKGTTYGAPTDLEVTLAQMLTEALPSVEMVRMVNSGTEATMSALRLARAYTNRSKIIKFEGCYHGHHDSLLIKAGSGALTHGVPTSPGVPENIASNTINARYNDLELLEKIFTEVGSDIAAIIVEPLAGNMGVVPPAEGFLQGLRDLCNKHSALLIFDEVITGFRLSYGGAQAYYNVMPDLTCLGKIIGGGLPVGAYGGRREIMQMVSPAGPVYQAGTLSGNPLAMTAGIATLKQLQQPGVYEELDYKSDLLAQGLIQAAKAAGVEASFNRVQSLQTCFFTQQDVRDFATASSSDTKQYAAFFRNMLEQGIYLAPAQFEATFVSLAHTENDIERTVEAAFNAFRAAAKE
ncbi:glutamate-1-semialdehyde 2,1-aminomutase [Desulforamulus reducens MI-1]|uniref:Glutamate-1-semialdehyde 2,1-aminomutase n=1 Tax=Desulforamulus reducens (strain ATCC BAA-1160 / DSM 100696 / MI-1) TaxID=349161 RepID=GSA_DESRM|nr:glutamate-1-semialdehyde 2,1-aminomutase [Desulforamulus reducens]A4J6H0.1 RecName: Full=Glutamate-1-semialdehyde 2,1-aminomutase; Short=GSA; AltName: Full=Glutamate-1-semialdehyde aminotransferase; Short=GSA-AT [Desulforamulus reducens MI-1]ABO50673.1 glutamate-1-semialdehyde 2,1-aminomutase [Desulforamulus reducens MI-1]